MQLARGELLADAALTGEQDAVAGCAAHALEHGGEARTRHAIVRDRHLALEVRAHIVDDHVQRVREPNTRAWSTERRGAGHLRAIRERSIAAVVIGDGPGAARQRHARVLARHLVVGNAECLVAAEHRRVLGQRDRGQQRLPGREYGDDAGYRRIRGFPGRDQVTSICVGTHPDLVNWNGMARRTEETLDASIVSGAPASLAPDGPTLAAGEVVANRYRLIRLIARGGMGEVYEAEDLELGGRIAIKTIRAERVGDRRVGRAPQAGDPGSRAG